MRGLQRNLFTCLVHLNDTTFDIVQGLDSRKSGGLEVVAAAVAAKIRGHCYDMYQPNVHDTRGEWLSINFHTAVYIQTSLIPHFFCLHTHRNHSMFSSNFNSIINRIGYSKIFIQFYRFPRADFLLFK